MGQKVNPHGFRVGPTLIKGWESVFYAKNDYADKLHQDLELRRIINTRCKQANISRIFVRRTSSSAIVDIYVRRPGVIIGKSGADIEKLKHEAQSLFGTDVFINVHEVKKPALDANIVAQSIAQQLENRVSFRKAMKLAMQNSFKFGAQGIKVACSGRLGGAEIARTEWYKEGKVPLHTLRADIDYATAQAMTTYGVIGIKVWIYKGTLSKESKRKW